MKYNLVVLFSLFMLTGCGSIKVTLPYHPVTTAEIAAHIEVEKFAYAPQAGTQQNQIRNTAIGSLLLTENIDDFYTNAVKREMRQAGISIKPNANCRLSGKLVEFVIDDLGFSATYATSAQYVLQRSCGNELFKNTYDVKFNTTKFVAAEVVYANLNKAISDNITQLLTDPQFIKVATEACGK